MADPPRGHDGRLGFRLGAPVAHAGPVGRLTLEDSAGHPLGRAFVPARSGSRALHLVLLLHGAGGSAAGALELLRPLAEAHGLLLVAPESAGRTWDVIRGDFGPDVRRVDQLLTRVGSDYPVSSLSIGGFSDGASYALSLGLVNGDLFDQVVAFSPGFTRARARRGRPPVFVSHGTEDRVLPAIRCSRRIVARLESQGYDVTYVEFDGGHTVPASVRRRAARWLSGDGQG